MHGSVPPLEPDVDAALDFLRWLRPGGPGVLTAIVADGITETTTTDKEEKVRVFNKQHAGSRNISYSLNTTSSLINKKPAKTDIAIIEFVLGDLDPDDGEAPDAAKARYLSQLDAFEPVLSGL